MILELDISRPDWFRDTPDNGVRGIRGVRGPIVESAAEMQGGVGSWLSQAAHAAAPFVGAIPGIGPAVSAGIHTLFPGQTPGFVGPVQQTQTAPTIAAPVAAPSSPIVLQMPATSSAPRSSRGGFELTPGIAIAGGVALLALVMVMGRRR